jgi:hypothetical protein
MKIEVSNGEIVDKLTILAIKLEQIKDKAKLKNVQTEYDELAPIVHGMYDSLNKNDQVKMKGFHQDLQNINQTLWNIEDQIRIHESKKDFEDDFVELARSVYFTNDERADVKKYINVLTGSLLVEEKSYEDYK